MYKTTIGIDGMSCGMCEAHINDAIRQNFKVKKVSSSHKDDETVVISKEELDENAVRNAIGNTGYTVTSFTIEPYEKKGIFG